MNRKWGEERVEEGVDFLSQQCSVAHSMVKN